MSLRRTVEDGRRQSGSASLAQAGPPDAQDHLQMAKNDRRNLEPFCLLAYLSVCLLGFFNLDFRALASYKDDNLTF